MAKTKKNRYIDQDLSWLREQAKQLREYVDNKPLSKLKDRIHSKTGTVIAKIEDQRKDLTAALKECIEIFDAIEKLETQEEAKQDAIRGDQNLTPFEDGTV